ncbi:hypothetical protein PMZ80_000878 [Knufia obscura]|uniref:Uncharacterized protein n=2 Tax=Knufia TaxID=430999 RepID=A0AAN8EQC9_9EURO|nr:hypothetical protein PMZ80_000878 [Knufia obscura]KAK5949858.1 hypothetical protein OHC33_009043 [Knufia fluminis]
MSTGDPNVFTQSLQQGIIFEDVVLQPQFAEVITVTYEGAVELTMMDSVLWTAAEGEEMLVDWAAVAADIIETLPL